MADLLDRFRLEDVRARNVDGDEQRPFRTRQFGQPARGVFRGPQQQVGADLDHRVRLVGLVDDRRRIDETEFRMLPARESFEARKLFRRQINDRLIDDLQLTLLDCLGEFGADVRVAVTAHGGVEDFDAIGAGALGAVHRKLGILQQIAFGRLIFVPCGDADGSGQDDFLIGKRDRRAQ